MGIIKKEVSVLSLFNDHIDHEIVVSSFIIGSNTCWIQYNI